MLSNGVGRKAVTDLKFLHRLLLATSLTGLVLIPMQVFAQSQLETETAQASNTVLMVGDSLYRFDIASQALPGALFAFSQISGIDVVFDGSLPEGVAGMAVVGEMTAAAALDRLLLGSGLVWSAVNETAVTITPADTSVNQDGATITAPVTVISSQQNIGYNGTPDWVYDTPGSVSVVTREAVEKRPPRNTSDIFRDMSGVSSTTNNQLPGFVPNIRGLQDFGRVNVMVDGARQNYQQSGHGPTSYTYFDPQLLSEAVVEKGPTSGVGGAGVIGGVVSLKTINTEDILEDDETYGGQATVTHGTNEYIFAGNAAVSARFSPKLDVTAAVAKKHLGSYDAGARDPLYSYSYSAAGNRTDERTDSQDNYVNFAQKQYSGLLKANVQATEYQSIHLGYVGYHNDFITGVGVDDTAAHSIKNQTMTGEYNWSPDSDWINFQAKISYNRAENEQSRDPRYNADGSVNYDGFSNHFETDTIGVSLQNTSYFDFSPAFFDITYGVEHFRDKTETQSVPYGLGDADTSWFEGATPAGERDVSSGFLEVDSSFADTVRLITGLRYDHYSLEGDTVAYRQDFGLIPTPPFFGLVNTAIPLTVDQSEGKLLPSATLSFEAFPAVKPYISYKKGYRPPQIIETMMHGFHVGTEVPFLPNPNLKGEKSTTKEIGVNVKLDDVIKPGDGFRMKAAYFNTRVEDYIAQAFVYLPGTFILPGVNSGYVNLIDPVEFQGSEFELAYDAGKYYIGAAYTFTLNDLTGNYDPFPLGQNATPGSSGSDALMGTNRALVALFTPPRHRVTVDLGTRLLDRDLTLGMRATYVSEATGYGASLENEYNAQYNLYDLYASYEFNDNLTLRFNVDNLFDEGYIESMSAGGTPAPGRTATLSITGRF